jgi:hypothetical protein
MEESNPIAGPAVQGPVTQRAWSIMNHVTQYPWVTMVVVFCVGIACGVAIAYGVLRHEATIH